MAGARRLACDGLATSFSTFAPGVAIVSPFAASLVRLLVLVSVASAAPARGADWSSFGAGTNVSVRIRDGRMLRGKIDPRTSDDAVWLTVEAAGVSITSATPASTVVEVLAADPVTLPPLWSGSAVVPAATAPTPQADPELIRVRSLEVGAAFANWDADAGIDGLRVCVAPRNAKGDIVAIGGSLQAELYLESGAKWPSNWKFQIAERWQVDVSPEVFGPEGATVILPFRQLQPELLREFPRLGVLQVRYVVPGQGVCDAVISDLPLAPPSWNRDRRELLTGDRRLPGETP